ncbi:MAG: hypothetical protein ACX93P_14810 [Roseovarius sp.]|nr:hypothetical protein [Roseovarius sp.]
MDTSKTAQYARALLSSFGGKAQAFAARRMRESDDAGQRQEAENWKKIRLAIAEMRGPRQT